jgi:hypothetical protein
VTDPKTSPTGDYDADGTIIIHAPLDGTPPYAVGPFPPIPELVREVLSQAKCSCTKTLMSIGFPKGMKMMLGADDLTTMGNLGFTVVAVADLVPDEPEDEPKGPVH